MGARAVSSLIVGISLGLAALASAQPADELAPGWRRAPGGGDRFVHTGGATLEVTASATGCAALARAHPAPRFDWLPATYWPLVDADGSAVTLCVQGVDGAALVRVVAPAGSAVDARFAPALVTVARELRPPLDEPTTGLSLALSSPAIASQRGVIAVRVDGTDVGFSLMLRDGSCAWEHALVLANMKGGAPSAAQVPGYWGTRFPIQSGYGLCLDLRDQYLTVLVGGERLLEPPALADLLAEIRRAAIAAHGAPVASDQDPMILPRTQQRVSATTGAGLWKAIAGERWDAPGGDALVTMMSLGFGTQHAITVSEGTCAPGTEPLGRTDLFPPELGPVWLERQDPAIRFRAWACVSAGGQTATIAVVGPLAMTDGPEPMASSQLRAMIGRIARSYGIEVRDESTPVPAPGGGGGGGGGGRRGDAAAHIGVYAGVINLAAVDGAERSTGGLVGATVRLATGRGAGIALGFDSEVGYADGELIGEIRAGIGLALPGRGAILDVVGGLSVGSTGPAAAIDAYAEASLTLFPRGGVLWIGALHAVGVGGPDHDRLEVRIVRPGPRDDGRLFLGVRAIAFGDPDEMTEGGTALLVMAGSGVVGGR